MVEVEQKFRGADFADLEHRLVARGARGGASRQETDHYFNAPDRDFARTDEALRVRRIGVANFVTYKGPKRDLQTKTRTEIEVPLAEGDAAAADFEQLLCRLGYQSVAVVRKDRRKFQLQRDGFLLEISLDRVEGLGDFAELEIVAIEEQLEAAKAVLLLTATELGLTAVERRSYLELLLASRTSAAGKPAG
jgi:adenylate cyclase class 2